MNLRVKFLSIVAFSCLICAVFAVGVAQYFSNKALDEGIIEKAKTIHSRLDVSTEYVANQGGLASAINEMTTKYTRPEDLTQEDKTRVLKQVPIFAAMQIGAKGAKEEMYDFRIFSDEPRRLEYKATEKEMEVFNKFSQDPNLKEWITNIDGKISVYKPIRLYESQGCLTCHGNPATSPWKDGRDVLGYKMENWTNEKLHGVFTIISDREEIKAVKAKNTMISSTTQIGLVIALGSFIAIFIAAFLVSTPLANLKMASSEVTQVANKLEYEVHQLSKLSHDLNATSNEQASAVQETAASMEEISSMGKKNADNARDSEKASNQSKREAISGQKVVGQMVESMKDINQSNDIVMNEIMHSNNKISEIVQVIREIDAKTKVINDIVFQTKLLSFNASVEAQRAGEHGKGFAVVAEEVGNLAQMSGKASKEISGLLEESIKKVEQIVEDTKTKVTGLMNTAKSTVDKGTKVANECGNILTRIVESSEQVSNMVESITNSTDEQSRGISDISKAIHQIDQATQKNSSAAMNSSQTAIKLSEQVDHLRSAFVGLKEVIDGKK